LQNKVLRRRLIGNPVKIRDYTRSCELQKTPNNPRHCRGMTSTGRQFERERVRRPALWMMSTMALGK